MEIVNLQATFGKLYQESLSLAKGLNIIYAPNETGKSTWSHFIKVMFYGLSTRERSILSDKNRCVPWCGSAPQGIMDIRLEDKHLTVTRTTPRAGSPMSDFHCFYTGTADELSYSGASFGEDLLGIPRNVFERTVFIGQNASVVSRDASLEERISSILTSGDESISFTRTQQTLKKELNSLTYPKTGKIPVLQEKIAAVYSGLQKADTLYNSIAELSDRLQTVHKTILSSKEVLQQWEEFQAQQQHSRYLEALADESSCKERLSSLLSSLPGLSRSVISGFEDRYRTFKDRREFLRHEKLEISNAISNARSLKSDWDLSEEKKNWSGYILSLLSVLFISGCAGVFLTTASGTVSLVLVILLLFLETLAAALHFRRTRQATALREKAYNALNNVKDRANELTIAEKNLLSSINELLGEISVYKECIAWADIPDCIADLSKQMDTIDDIRDSAKRAELTVSLLKESLPPDIQCKRPEKPDISMEKAAEDLALAESEYTELSARIQLFKGQLKEVGNREDLIREKQSLDQELSELNAQADSLTLALNTLDESYSELSSRFGPEISKETCRIFSLLTDSRYSEVLLNRDFGLKVRLGNDAQTHDVPLLSQGSADQLYFSLRLALSHTILPDNLSVPMILDDVFAYYDDKRLQKVLDYLLEESLHRQIILFTCHKREGEYLASDSRVTYQELNEMNI